MKTLIVEVIDAKRIGELVTVGRIFGDTPDIVALGTGDDPRYLYHGLLQRRGRGRQPDRCLGQPDPQ